MTIKIEDNLLGAPPPSDPINDRSRERAFPPRPPQKTETFRQRTGKIARLPLKLRTNLNQRIRDGATSAAIIQFLDSQKIPGVNAMNLSHWRHGGYRDWLADQQQVEGIREKRRFTRELIRASLRSRLSEAAVHLVASQLYQVIEDFDVENLKALLRSSPKNYSAFTNLLVKLNKITLDREKFQFDAAAASLAQLPKLNAIAEKPTISEAEKQAAIRKILFPFK